MKTEDLLANKLIASWKEEMHTSFRRVFLVKKRCKNGFLFSWSLSFVLFGIAGLLYWMATNDLSMPIMLSKVHHLSPKTLGDFSASFDNCLQIFIISVSVIVFLFTTLGVFLNKSFEGLAKFFMIPIFMFIISLPMPTNFSSTTNHRPISESYIKAQAMIVNHKETKDRADFISLVRVVDNLHGQYKPSGKVLFVLDKLAFGKAVANSAIQYQRHRISSATFDFCAEHISLELAEILFGLGTISAVWTRLIARNEKKIENIFSKTDPHYPGRS